MNDINMKGNILEEVVAMLVGAIELGGTNCNCAIGLPDGTIVKKIRFSTEDPSVTIGHVINFFTENKVTALGIGSFGPINVDRRSSEYGTILQSPKKEWVNYPLVQQLQKHLKIPILLYTDVTASGLGEYSALEKSVSTVLYVTIGTGIGGGIVIKNEVPYSSHHAEMGHVTLQRVDGDVAESVCPFHSNCLEGLASGTAIEKRWGQKAHTLSTDHQAWEWEADYIAQGLCQFIYTMAPDRIILGGGVMQQPHLLAMIRRKVKEKIGGYYFYDELKCLEELIVLPALDENSALVGCLRMHNSK